MPSSSAVDAATRDKLAELSRELGITEFMLLQAAVAVVLHKAGGGVDIPIGTPVAGRNESELDQLIGFFINILVLRNDLRGNPTLREVLQRAREMALAAYAHQDLPFDQVVDAVSPARSLSRNPLFDVVVHVREQLPQDRVIDSGPDGDTTFTALEPTFDVAHADMSVNFFASDDGYRGHVIYRTELYKRSTAQRFAEWLVRVIEAFADRPDQPLREVEIGSAQERQRILDQSNAGGGTARVYLLDASLNPVPVGVVGDVYYGGGPAVSARLAGPSLTATRFVADPFAAQPGSRLYRNGERGVWNDDGQLELLVGIEPASQGRAATPVTGPAEPPNTATERALAAILTDVLDAGEVGRYDEFFNLGGDSILAVRVAAQARDAGLPLTPRMVFEHPVLAGARRRARRQVGSRNRARRHALRADEHIGIVGRRTGGPDLIMGSSAVTRADDATGHRGCDGAQPPATGAVLDGARSTDRRSRSDDRPVRHRDGRRRGRRARRLVAARLRRKDADPAPEPAGKLHTRQPEPARAGDSDAASSCPGGVCAPTRGGRGAGSGRAPAPFRLGPRAADPLPAHRIAATSNGIW